MESISSVLQSVQKDLIKVNQDFKKESSQNILLNKHKLKDANRKKIKLLDQQGQTDKDEKKLEFKKKIQIIEKLKNSIKNQIRLNKKDIQNVKEQDQKIAKQLLRMLNDIDSIQTHSLNRNTEGGSTALSPQNSLKEAVQAGVMASKNSKKVRSEIENGKHNLMQNQRKQGISFIQKQIKKLKQMKVFKIVMNISLKGASMIKGGWGIAAQAALKALDYIVTSEMSKKIKNYNRAEADVQKNLQKQAKSQQKQIQKNQKIEALEKKTLNSIKNATKGS